MEKENTFKTKTGYCHILPDRIVLTRDGSIGNVASVVSNNNLTRILMVYVAFSVFLLYLAFKSSIKGQFFMPIFYGTISFYLMYGVFASRNNSSTPVIERNKIKEIKYKKAIFGLTRARFEVFFEDEKGKIKKRIIMLPGSLSDGKVETEKALVIMKQEGLL